MAEPAAPPWRPSPWRLALLALPGALALLWTTLALLGVGWSPLWDLSWSFGSLSALIGALAARSRATDEARSRWTLWAVAAGCWFAAQLSWNVFDLTGQPGMPNPTDVFWWGFALAVCAAALRTPVRTRTLRVLVALESLPLIGGAVTVPVALLWNEFSASPIGTPGRAAALAYPIIFIAMLVLVLQSLIGGSLRGVRHPGVLLTVAGILLQAVAFSFWAEFLLRGIPLGHADLLDASWTIGLVAMSAGGLLTARNPEVARPAEESGPRSGILPGGVFLILLAATVQSRIIGAGEGPATALRVGLLCSGSALMLRSTILARRLRQMLEGERNARHSLAERESRLAQLNERLVEDSRRDPLTGLRNRRALSEDLALLEDVRRQSGTPFAFALCDIDHFKAYNDQMGHLAGDQALRMLANVVRSALRTEDTAYRFGGEELLLMLRMHDPREALRAVERVRAAVERAAFPHPGGIGGVLTVSVGVAIGEDEAATVIARADSALYEAKHFGRNAVRLAAEAGIEPAPQPVTRAARDTEPVPVHLRSLLRISRAGSSGRGTTHLMEVTAEAICDDFGYSVVAANMLSEDRRTLNVVAVHGDSEARKALLGTSSAWSEWAPVLAPDRDRCGAFWLPAGSYEWEGPGFWVPSAVAAPGPDAWHPDDMLLLPLRAPSGEMIGVLSLDQPLAGRRPSDGELEELMTVADHAALAAQRAADGGEPPAPLQVEPGEMRVAAVMLLAETLDLRDAGTAKHSRNVGDFARATAEALGLEANRVERIHVAGVLHDLGKLGIADKILHKPGALDAAEWREMRRHSEIGARILEHAGLRDIAAWVRSHHERLDGTGYPRLLDASQIALEARILAVADAYEAMTADRPYRSAMAEEEAQAELRRHCGTQFDDDVVEAFLRGREAGRADRSYRAAA